MIPPDKIEAVTRGLREAFGVTQLEDISPVSGGHTPSLVFRIVVAGSPYLMKIITRKEDPTRHYTSMRSAADAGIAPQVWYTSAPDHISITDFVDNTPLSRSEALIRLPAVLRALHALPPFDKAPFNTTCTFLLNRGPFLDGFLKNFQSARIVPDAVWERLFTLYEQLSAACQSDDADMVASHNDLFKPDNILFDGRRISLVDWEAAFLNDRYADLAVLANQLVTNDDEEQAYLEDYFGAPPDRYQQAKFHLMQQLAHLFYTLAFLHHGATGKPADWSAPVPELIDYQRRLWAQEFDLLDKDVKIVYARVQWERLLRNVAQPRYEESLRIVSPA
jgi:hypothetical protein